MLFGSAVKALRRSPDKRGTITKNVKSEYPIIQAYTPTPCLKKLSVVEKKWLSGLIHKFVLLLTNVEPETMSSITLEGIGKSSGIALLIKSIERMGHHSTATNVKRNFQILSGIIM
ncbi:hypothetical protein RCL_jg11501.t1 [Rhizophagus clarus]|uniref:Uncharacterized protein n=1 Tax=Rhizophagus clarus TaxID=94130 RepID=A0A8H3QN36_9GLOM|nr:hypothetical protein RCL_jg11501.t1 [Rhizophagus clarus]